MKGYVVFEQKTLMYEKQVSRIYFGSLLKLENIDFNGGVLLPKYSGFEI